MSLEHGLSSDEAYKMLLMHARQAVSTWKEAENDRVRALPASSPSQKFSPSLTGCIYGILLSIFLCVGAVDLENEISTRLLIIACVVFVYSIAMFVLQRAQSKCDDSYLERKVVAMLNYMDRSCPVSDYSTTIEPLTEDMWGQQCMRDGMIVNVPKLLLVKGDTILLRPGQLSPCACTTRDGIRLKRGDSLDRSIVIDEKTEVAHTLQPTLATVEESIIHDFIFKTLTTTFRTSVLADQISYFVGHIGARYILPVVILSSSILAYIRFCYATSESLYGSRFIFSTVPLIITPLLCPPLPFITWIVKKWNNRVVCAELAVPYFDSPKDLLAEIGSLTGVSVVDKKGVLSPMNPCLDKVIVFRESGVSPDDAVPEVMDLSSEQLANGQWRLYFDDPSWSDFAPQLSPLALNMQLLSCRHTSAYFRFLDHLSCVSETVPRTIVTASRRCMCHFPPLLGFDDDCTKQFHDHAPQLIGFYKRQPGDAPMPGLTKHRTPLEMAFCSVHPDDRSIHSHISCQGTANIVLEASSHVWIGDSIVPLSGRLIRIVKDIYHRNSMTGYCLALSYRATGFSLSPSMEGNYVEIPLTRTTKESNGFAPRSHSFDNLLRDEFFCHDQLERADDVIENMFSGHALCGMVVMQYEALPAAVQLVDRLESACIRFVYFSRENELRSRVFAEKLGLEAGWNCHVSLAEEDADSDDDRSIKDVFKASVAKHRKQWAKVPRIQRKRNGYLSRSEVLLPGAGDSEIPHRHSPCRRHSSTSPEKVGPMPNKAQLPTGVRDVRPHLREVDNVPLLVGLFTDCSPAANTEMVQIMQEYDEVVMTIGSALNIANTDIYIQSDLSVCVLPLRDSNCTSPSPLADPAPSPTSPTSSSSPPAPSNPAGSRSLSANQLAASLMAMAADFALDHSQLLLLPDVVTACRHRLSAIRSSLLFLLLSSFHLSLAMFLSALFFLPVLFSTEQVMLTVFLQLPLLFVGIVWTPFHPPETVIRIAAKNTSLISSTSVRYAIVTFLIEFLPSTLCIIALFFIALLRNSTLLCSFSDVVCSLGVDVAGNLSTHEIRHVVGLHMIVYLCACSISWVHPLSAFWTTVPLKSIPWLLAVTCCIASQAVFSHVSGASLFRVLSLPSLALLLAWAAVVAVCCELWKLRTIRQFQREQRRTKLAFDTKLGMNSPY